MSLKAKIEAVIYAAEEPVTVAQLAAIFSTEVIEHREARLRAEAEAAAAPEIELAAEEGVEPVEDASPDDGVLSGEMLAEAATEEVATAEDAEPASEEAAEPEVVEAASEETAPEAEAAEPETVETAEVEGTAETIETVDPVDLKPAAELTPEDERRLARQRDRELREEVRLVMAELIAEYATNARGMEIREIAGGYRVSTKAEYHDAVRSFVKSLKPPLKLSLQALETLAVIAYKQPVTAPEVGEIRGVDSGGVLGSLVTRKLITTAGRKQVVGRPILYKTTKEFLLRFGLKDLNELPSLEEFEKMASELTEAEEPMAENAPLPFDGDQDAEEVDEEAEEAAASNPVEPEVEVVEVEGEAEVEPVAEAAVEPEEVEPEEEAEPAGTENEDQEGTIPEHVAKAIVVTEYEEAEADLPSVEAHVEPVTAELAVAAEESEIEVEVEKEEA